MLTASVTLLIVLFVSIGVIGVYTLCHMALPIPGPRTGWRLIANSVVMAMGTMLFFYVSVGAVYRGVRFLLDSNTADKLYGRAYLLLQSHEDESAPCDRLFMQRITQLHDERNMHSMCRLEWWTALALWNEGRLRRLKHRYYDGVLPACKAEPLPKARL